MINYHKHKVYYKKSKFNISIINLDFFYVNSYLNQIDFFTIFNGLL